MNFSKYSDGFKFSNFHLHNSEFPNINSTIFISGYLIWKFTINLKPKTEEKPLSYTIRISREIVIQF